VNRLSKDEQRCRVRQLLEVLGILVEHRVDGRERGVLAFLAEITVASGSVLLDCKVSEVLLRWVVNVANHFSACVFQSRRLMA
jgi:hypothetical protein